MKKLFILILLASFSGVTAASYSPSSRGPGTSGDAYQSNPGGYDSQSMNPGSTHSSSPTSVSNPSNDQDIDHDSQKDKSYENPRQTPGSQPYDSHRMHEGPQGNYENPYKTFDNKEVKNSTNKNVKKINQPDSSSSTDSTRGRIY